MSAPKTAASLKEEGNAHFKTGHYFDAIDVYTVALGLSPSDSLRNLLLRNRAAANLKLYNYNDVVADCSEAIDINSSDQKAKFRRCQAYEKLNELENAFNDAVDLVLSKPEVKELPEMLILLEKRLGAEKGGVITWHHYYDGVENGELFQTFNAMAKGKDILLNLDGPLCTVSLAAKHGHEKLLYLLLNSLQIARLERNLLRYTLRAALMQAFYKDHVEIVRLLLESLKHFQMSTTDLPYSFLERFRPTSPQTCSQRAMYRGDNPKIIELLLQHREQIEFCFDIKHMMTHGQRNALCYMIRYICLDLLHLSGESCNAIKYYCDEHNELAYITPFRLACAAGRKAEVFYHIKNIKALKKEALIEPNVLAISAAIGDTQQFLSLYTALSDICSETELDKTVTDAVQAAVSNSQDEFMTWFFRVHESGTVKFDMDEFNFFDAFDVAMKEYNGYRQSLEPMLMCFMMHEEITGFVDLDDTDWLWTQMSECDPDTEFYDDDLASQVIEEYDYNTFSDQVKRLGLQPFGHNHLEVLEGKLEFHGLDIRSEYGKALMNPALTHDHQSLDAEFDSASMQMYPLPCLEYLLNARVKADPKYKPSYKVLFETDESDHGVTWPLLFSHSLETLQLFSKYALVTDKDISVNYEVEFSRHYGYIPYAFGSMHKMALMVAALYYIDGEILCGPDAPDSGVRILFNWCFHEESDYDVRTRMSPQKDVFLRDLLFGLIGSSVTEIELPNIDSSKTSFLDFLAETKNRQVFFTKLIRELGIHFHADGWYSDSELNHVVAKYPKAVRDVMKPNASRMMPLKTLCRQKIVRQVRTHEPGRRLKDLIERLDEYLPWSMVQYLQFEDMRDLWVEKFKTDTSVSRVQRANCTCFGPFS